MQFFPHSPPIWVLDHDAQNKEFHWALKIGTMFTFVFTLSVKVHVTISSECKKRRKRVLKIHQNSKLHVLETFLDTPNSEFEF